MGDSHVILTLILSWPILGGGGREEGHVGRQWQSNSNMVAESTSDVRGSKNFLNQNSVTLVT